MSLRLFHRGARGVWKIRRPAPGFEQWLSVFITSPDWAAILGGQLTLLGLAPQGGPGGTSLACRLGEISWTRGRRWSIIALRFNSGSETKRRLVTAALLRAARYARPAP